MQFNEHSDFQLLRNGIALKRGDSAVGDQALDFLDEWRKDDPTISLQTSGSTGVPKVVQVEKAVMWHSATATIAALGLAESIHALLALSPQYIAGKMMIVRALLGGWKLHVHDLSTAILDDLRSDFDFAALVPLQVKGRATQLNKIGTTILGGAPVDAGLLDEMNEVKTRVFETYGMTETVSHIALKELRPHTQDAFHAVPGVTFSVNADSELRIHAPQWNHTELQTTDVVSLLNENTFVWKGRSDFVINSGGVKIHPEKVEPILSKLVGKSVYVTSRQDDALGRRLVAIVEGEVPELSRELLQSSGLSVYETPKAWLSVSSFPMTESGKIVRHKL
ncbi:AMP-binding protein [Phaeocystidibacter luteus]|uniref:AMP-binding protein n=1 Tax=Phaeocystidibacter luteus TaxID=911197 RepID=A0A6N6RME0_9FLAO|nr:AMP-binding protein [Phaeocystidibacter luteus]KAB2814736.1 AMP-binding protein [Phaeocystidibacter luteus]